MAACSGRDRRGVPGASIRIVIAGGSSIVVQSANIVKLAKEMNPAHRGPTVGATTTSPAAPATKASSGLRLALLPSVAVHSEIDDATFMLTAKLGWEIGLEKWGLTPASP